MQTAGSMSYTTCLGKLWRCLAILPALLPFVCSAQVQSPGVAPTGSVLFPTTTVGTHAAAQLVSLVTQTDETISSMQVPTSLGGQQEFIVGPITGCVVDGSTINPQGTVCTVSITFSPAYPGVRNLPLQIVTGNGNSSIGLSGTGTGPLAVVAPGSATVLNFTQANQVFTNGVAVDGVGNAYVASAGNNIIVKIDATTGGVTTIAGTGTPDFNYDGIAATQAYLYNPTGVAVDSAGDVFIADTNNNKVREVAAGTGIINTLAGKYNGGYQLSGFTGDGGPAYNSLVSAPSSLSLDRAGNLYIADTGNQRIRRIDAVTGYITTVAGSGSTSAGSYSGDGGPATAATLNQPGGVTSDAVGNLYIADTGNNVIRRVDAISGNITTIVGNGTAGFTGDGGPALQAELSGPTSVALDAANNLYITDQNNARLRKVDIATGIISTVAGNGFVPGSQANRVGKTGSSTSLAIGAVTGVASDAAGNLYFAESNEFDNSVFKVTANTSVLTWPTVTLVNTTDTADGPLRFTLSNDGNSSLSLSSQSSGANPAIPTNWMVDGASPCQPTATSSPAQTIASGGSCVFALDFQPSITGAVQGAVTLTDNSLNASSATQTVSLSGTAASASDTTISVSFTYIANFPPNYYSLDNYLNYDSIDTLTATVGFAAAGVTGTVSGTVTFYDNGTAIPGGSNLALTNGVATFTFIHLLAAGNHSITATFTPASGSSLNASTTAAALTEVVSKGVPALSLSVDNHIYDGNPHGVTITTVPANLPATTYYALSTSIYLSTTVPTLPGLYNVSIYVSSANYSYSTLVYLSIYNLPATITLANLQAAYDGNPHGATATTVPSGLNVKLTYNGSTTVPSAVGRYAVVATIVDPIYAGTASGTLEIYSTGLATTTWVVNADSTVSHLSAQGAVLTTAGAPSGASSYGAIAIDATGNAWSVTNGNNVVMEVSPAGAVAGTYTGGGVSAPASVAIDGAGQVWVANGTNNITELTNAGVAVSPANGFLSSATNLPSVLAAPSSIAVDSTGSVWVTNQGNSTVVRIFGAAAPVVTPTVLGVSSSTEGNLP